MARYASVFGLLVLVAAVVIAVPARAEFFGCNSKNDRGRLLYSYSGTPSGYTSRSAYTHAARWTAHPQVSHSRAYYGSGHSWNDRSRW